MSAPNIDPAFAESIEAQVERILTSRGLARSERLRGLLRFLVSETLAGRSRRLKGYTLAVEVFGRDESFDPQLDSVVRAAIGRLRRRLAHYYLEEGRDDPVLIELPKGSYVPKFGTLETRAGDAAARAPQPAREPVVAVLPFDNLSGEPEQEYFSDGISEEIIAELSRLPGLRIIARNTTFRYKGQAVDVQALGRELGVGYVLEGSVRKAGRRIRVTAQLLEASGGTHLWAESYDRELAPRDILDVQEDIARRLAGSIGQPSGVIFSSEMAASRRKPAGSLEAYDLVLRWYAYDYRGLQPDEHRQLREALERAVELDPHYAEAHGALASLYLDEHRTRFNRQPGEDPLQRAREIARRAVELDPRSAVARQVLFNVHFHQGDLDRFEVEGERAVALNPSHADSLADFGMALVYCGRWERGRALLEQALALNPSPAGWYFFPLALDAYRRRAYPEALDAALSIRLEDFFWTWAFLAMIYGQLGDREAEMRGAVARLLELYPEFPRQARQELAKFHFPGELVGHCVEGWRKAGLDVG